MNGPNPPAIIRASLQRVGGFHDYKIAMLPGDGVEGDIPEAAKGVLDAVGFEADCEYGDIGWEFWRSEGNPLPDRTIDLLKCTDCWRFGAITLKPKDEAAAELDPKLKDKGFVYSRPIVGIRQRSLKCDCDPALSFSLERRHLSTNSCGVIGNPPGCLREASIGGFSCSLLPILRSPSVFTP